MVVTTLSLLLDKKANLSADRTRHIPGKPFQHGREALEEPGRGVQLAGSQQILEVYPTRGPGPRGVDIATQKCSSGQAGAVAVWEAKWMEE